MLGRALIPILALALTTCMAHRPEQVAGPDELVSESAFPAAEVKVYEDAWGVPHVKAQSIEDAAWAMGVLHAEERLWQMDLNRRIGEGRLSEILGERTVAADRFLRQRLLAESAKQALARLSAEERGYLDAYAQGVNDAIASMKQLPPEYRLLRIEPAPWTALDSMVWIKVMALNLSGNVASELLREDMVTKLGPERADWFLTGYPKDGPRILPPSAGTEPAPEPEPAANGAEAESPEAAPATEPAEPPANAGQLAQARREVEAMLGSFEGLASNNWVIAGSKTASGKPILANDPHLAVGMPSVWYLIEIDAPGFHVVGSSFPGFPGIAIGHNEHLAWGITTGGLDPHDLFYEEIKDGKVRDGDGWVELTKVKQTIEVRRGKSVPIEILVGPRGPIVTEYFEGVKQDVSLRWIAHDPDDTTFQAFLGLGQATNWDEFRAALALFTSPAHNFVYADREGHVGWKVAGKVPIRQGRDGQTPARGWEPADAWQGYVPPAELPETLDPEQGFVATANNHPVPDGWTHDLGFHSDTPYRARRISEELSARDGWTMPQVRTLQMDVHSAQARELLPFLQSLQPRDAWLADAAALWKDWDGAMTADSAAAALYEVWLNEVTDVIARHHLGDALYERFAAVRGTFLRQVFTGEAAALCEQPGVADCRAAAEIGLGRAVIRLRRELGPEPAAWRWGDLHEIVFHHRLGVTKGLRRRLDAHAPAPGNRFTVNVAGYDAKTYTQTWHPSYRQVIDPSDWGTATWMFAPGQSGVHYRAHYRDLVDPYMKGEQVPMLFGEAAEREAVRVRTFRRR